MMQRFYLFPDEGVPEDIKNLMKELPQPQEVPRHVDDYTQEETETFLRVWSPPRDYEL